MLPRAQNVCAPFVQQSAMQLASMVRLYQTPPSRLLSIEDPYAAWCLDEAVAYLLMRMQNGDKPRPKKTEDNRALLRELGIEISGAQNI